MTWPRRIAAVLALAGLAWTCLAHAQASRVVLVGPSARHPTLIRVRDELRLLGLEVEVVAQSRGEDLPALARTHGAAAAARIEQAPPEIVIWVDPERSGGRVQEGTELRAGESLGRSPEPELLALRAVELLRARLIPVPPGAAPDAEEPGTEAPPGKEDPPEPAGAAPAEPTPAAPPSPPAPAPSRPEVEARPRPLAVPSGMEAPAAAGEAKRGSLSVGGALGFGPGGLPPALLGRVGVGWRLLPRLGLEATALVPLGDAGAQSERGGVRLRTLPLLAGGALEIARPTPQLAAFGGAGAGAALLLFEGEAAPPFEAASGSRWVAAPYLSAGLGYRLGERLGLRAEVLGALLVPEPVLRIAGREAASFGRPAVFAALGVEVWP